MVQQVFVIDPKIEELDDPYRVFTDCSPAITEAILKQYGHWCHTTAES